MKSFALLILEFTTDISLILQTVISKIKSVCIAFYVEMVYIYYKH